MGFTLSDHTEELKRASQQQIENALEACGLAGERYGKENLTNSGAVDTGNLRNSVTHKVVPEERCVYIGTNVEYGKYIEFGTGKYTTGGRQTPWIYTDNNGNVHRTSGMKARPFIKPALTNHTSVYDSLITRYLTQ